MPGSVDLVDPLASHPWVRTAPVGDWIAILSDNPAVRNGTAVLGQASSS